MKVTSAHTVNQPYDSAFWPFAASNFTSSDLVVHPFTRSFQKAVALCQLCHQQYWSGSMYCRLSVTIELCHVLHSAPATAAHSSVCVNLNLPSASFQSVPPASCFNQAAWGAETGEIKLSTATTSLKLGFYSASGGVTMMGLQEYKLSCNITRNK